MTGLGQVCLGELHKNYLATLNLNCTIILLVPCLCSSVEVYNYNRTLCCTTKSCKCIGEGGTVNYLEDAKT